MAESVNYQCGVLKLLILSGFEFNAFEPFVLQILTHVVCSLHSHILNTCKVYKMVFGKYQPQINLLPKNLFVDP